jgi:hypothetical protein
VQTIVEPIFSRTREPHVTKTIDAHNTSHNSHTHPNARTSAKLGSLKSGIFKSNTVVAKRKETGGPPGTGAGRSNQCHNFSKCSAALHRKKERKKEKKPWHICNMSKHGCDNRRTHQYQDEPMHVNTQNDVMGDICEGSATTDKVGSSCGTGSQRTGRAFQHRLSISKRVLSFQ